VAQRLQQPGGDEGSDWMVDREEWNWDTGKKLICDLRALQGRFDQVHEWAVSADGERIAAPVLTAPDVFRVWVNDSLWEGEFEKAWHLVFGPDGRLTALVRVDDEWTVGIDGELWDERWEFAWNPTFNGDGSVIAVQIKDNMEYTVAVNGRPWERRFHSSRGLVVSDNGSHVAALVQVEPLAEADTVGFMEGTWSVAVDGTPWERKFINVYGPAITADGTHVAAEVRLDICDYTLAEDAVLWDTTFGCVWEPTYRNGRRALLAPVRIGGSWTIAENGSPIWDSRYMQLWNQRVSADGEHIAAVAAASFGSWTIVVDDRSWHVSFDDLVLPPVFSPDGLRVAAGVRAKGSWGVAVDGETWAESYDMVWDPVFNPSGDRVTAKVERDGRFAIAVDGKVWSPWYGALWEPIISPDGTRLLIRAVEDGTYFRQVVAFDTVFQG